MAEICSCKTGILNHGQPACVDSFARDARLIFVQYKSDAGVINSISSTDTLDQTYFDGKFNNTDLSQRWFLTPTINNVVGERAESVKQDIDGIQFNVRQGVRTYDGTFYGGVAAPEYEEALESMACQTVGFFIIDVAGNIIGMENAITGDLDPILIQRNTLDVMYKFPTASEVQSIRIMFNYEENERDSNLAFIGADNIAVEMLSQESMATVTIEVQAGATVTGATIDMAFLYGEVFDKLAYQGAVIGDFTLLDNTGSSVAITSVTESSTVEGEYAIVYPDQTGNTPLTLSYQKVTGSGFETRSAATITP